MPFTKSDPPETLQRSPEKVRRTYIETLDSAEEQHDSQERAHRTAWKHSDRESARARRG